MAESEGSRRGLVPLMAAYAAFGAFWGTWVVVFADFLEKHDLSPGQVSLPMTLLSVVAILVMTFVAPRLEPFARGTNLAAALLIHALGSILMGLLASGWVVLAFVAIGVGTGLVDVVANAAGHQIETRARAPVLQWVHASYGAGSAVAALVAGVALTLGAPFEALLLGAGASQLAASALVRGAPALQRLRGSRKPSGRSSLSAFARAPFLLIPAVVVMSAFFVEGSMDVWSVIFLRESLTASVLAGAAGFTAFALATTVGRAFAARVLFGMGYRRTILVSGAGSMAAGLVAVSTSSTVVASVAFLALGFFLSAAAPAAYGLAGMTRVEVGVAVAAITTVGYTGFVVGPPIMGWLADAVGLRATMAGVAVATLGIVVGAAAAWGAQARREVGTRA